ncbi:MAG: TlpA family protein disulfide reductase [Akkermansiaceae bacterium]|nr:TlpA family protein disulfide reductase [Armatimonadota bacterium]
MKQQLPGWLSGSIVAAVAIGSVYLLGVSTTPSEERALNKPAPAIQGTLTTGSPFRLSDYRGKVVMINFWGTWCGPCIQELPDLIAVQSKYQARGFTIIGLADNNDPRLTEVQYREALQDYISEKGINYPNVPIPDGTKAAYGLEAFPTSLLLDKNGKVVYATVGPINPAEIGERIEKLL